jgi:hypothetical protein
MSDEPPRGDGFALPEEDWILIAFATDVGSIRAWLGA